MIFFIKKNKKKLLFFSFFYSILVSNTRQEHAILAALKPFSGYRFHDKQSSSDDSGIYPDLGSGSINILYFYL